MRAIIYKDINIKKNKTIEYNKLQYDHKNKKMKIEVITEERNGDKEDKFLELSKKIDFRIILDSKYCYHIELDDEFSEELEDLLEDNRIRYDILN